MEEKVILSYSSLVYFNKLTHTLYDKEYFGFIENADTYVNKIVDEIVNKLPSAKHYNTPDALKKYGRHYIKIATNIRCGMFSLIKKTPVFLLTSLPIIIRPMLFILRSCKINTENK